MRVNWFKLDYIKTIQLMNCSFQDDRISVNNFSNFLIYLKQGFWCKDCNNVYGLCGCNYCNYCKYDICLCNFLNKELIKLFIQTWPKYNLK